MSAYEKYKHYHFPTIINLFYNLNSLLRNGFLEISDEITFTNKPLVALESTIITHGLPYPNNLETALEVENEVRTNNAMPGK